MSTSIVLKSRRMINMDMQSEILCEHKCLLTQAVILPLSNEDVEQTKSLVISVAMNSVVAVAGPGPRTVPGLQFPVS